MDFEEMGTIALGAAIGVIAAGIVLYFLQGYPGFKQAHEGFGG